MSGSNLSEMEDVKYFLMYFEDFSSEIQEKIRACSLNLNPAMDRCSLVHRSDPLPSAKQICVEMTPTFVVRNCPDGFIHSGCCHCVLKCPRKYKDLGFHCVKPAFRIMDVYINRKECGSDCDPYGVDKVYFFID